MGKWNLTPTLSLVNGRISTNLYTERNGFRSVHVPSLSYLRSIVDGAMYTENYQSYGYIVDVYDGFIILNGWDFINNRYHPLGVIKIDTTLQTIPAGTFADPTGVIQT